ncbi:MAG: carbohydrate ABC transporter permease, partial [Clostridia bacterium]|nr:carbohydrate ABC transporter permease [Clostridia bacterium]
MKRSSGFDCLIIAFLIALCLLFLFPLVIVLINSFKSKLTIMSAPFALPDADTFVGLANYQTGIENTGFFEAFGRSLFITVGSVALIVLGSSMTAWFITRVRTWW